MILEIDVGNTWAKWRLQDGQQLVGKGKVLTAEFPRDDFRALDNVRAVRLASVASRANTAAMAQTLSTLFGVDVRIAETAAQQAGLTNAYADPTQLGVDRWLAMLAAFNAAKHGCLVVSCGTAVTIDSIRDDGVHEGGYILPGLIMMRSALLAQTGRIQFKPGDFELTRNLGTSTAAAVEHGAVHAVLSAIEATYRDRVKRLGACSLFITGGDGASLAKQLDRFASPVSCHYVEDLVLNGLQYALP